MPTLPRGWSNLKDLSVDDEIHHPATFFVNDI